MITAISDKVFFEQLYLEYEQKIFFAAFGILNNKEQAEDVTQEVFIQLYQDLAKFKTYEKLRQTKFILRVTKNKAIDLYRKNKVEISYISRVVEQKGDEDVQDNTDASLNKMMSAEEFQSIAAYLQEPYLQVFMYQIFYGLSTKETAAIMGVKVDTLKKQFERAKFKVKTILGGKGHEQNYG